MSDAIAAPQVDAKPAAPWPVVARVVGIGAAFDIAVYGQQPGLSIPLFILLVVTLARGAVRRSILEDLFLGTAAVFASFAAFRASEPLVAMDMLAAMSFLALAATSHSGTTLVALLDKAADLARAIFGAPGFVLRPLARASKRLDLGRARPAARAALIGVPLLIVFAALLASADRVFADVITPGFPRWRAGTVLAHAALIMLGILGGATLLRAAARRKDRGAEDAGWSGAASEHAPFTDWAFILAGIDLLFAGFVAIQLTVLFGGEHRVRVTPGLTYAEYARTGFFQLIVVAVLTTLLILGVWDFGKMKGTRERAWFRGLVSVLVALTGVILASALKRLALYEGTYGFTLARFTGYVVIALIGAFLAGTLVLVWTQNRRAVITLAIGCLAVGLVTVNVLDPERFVAERNIARFDATGKIDVVYLGAMLGADAVPAQVASCRGCAGTTRARCEHCCACGRPQSDTVWMALSQCRARAGPRGACARRHKPGLL